VVLERDRPQRVAYLEALGGTTHEATAATKSPPPSPLYDAGGEAPVPDELPTVLPPPPARRVILAFDASNSKRRVRDEWKRAAQEWVATSMRPEDLVGVVVLRRRLDWLQGLTANATELARQLKYLDLDSELPNRDRRDDVSRMISEIEPCLDVSGAPRPRRQGATVNNSVAGQSDAVSCSLQIAESWVGQWAAESEESIELLATLTGQLSAVAGRKEVVLFSEGIIPDAAAAGSNVMLAVFGERAFSWSSLTTRFGKDSMLALAGLHEAARAADVVFFTLDTRTGAERGYSEDIDRAQPLAGDRLGINPWTDMYQATSGTLAVLAEETGGRAFFGRDDLADSVRRAADDFFAIYTLGYYRDDSEDPPGKVRIKSLRKGVKLDYSGRLAEPARPARAVTLDLSIGRPEATGEADRQRLPVAVQTALDELPLRRGGGVRGCNLGVWLQAVTPDGTLAGEIFETTTVAVDKPDDAAGKPFRHVLSLDLPPGPYRVRARLSDDRRQVLGERVIDLTLTMGNVLAGHVPPAEPE